MSAAPKPRRRAPRLIPCGYNHMVREVPVPVAYRDTGRAFFLRLAELARALDLDPTLLRSGALGIWLETEGGAEWIATPALLGAVVAQAARWPAVAARLATLELAADLERRGRSFMDATTALSYLKAAQRVPLGFKQAGLGCQLSEDMLQAMLGEPGKPWVSIHKAAHAIFLQLCNDPAYATWALGLFANPSRLDAPIPPLTDTWTERAA